MGILDITNGGKKTLYWSNYLLLRPLHPSSNAHIDIHRKYSIAAIKERNDSIQTKSWKCKCVYEPVHKGISTRSLICFDWFEAGKKSLEREPCPGGAKIHLYLCVVTDKNKSHLCRQHFRHTCREVDVVVHGTHFPFQFSYFLIGRVTVKWQLIVAELWITTFQTAFAPY